MNSHKTALKRKQPSAPAQLLYRTGKMNGRMLDYGCGHGLDAKEYGMDKYDPHHFPCAIIGEYDTILCTYVLNTLIQSAAENIIILLRHRLTKNGRAYITVRRGMKKEGETQRGTFQRNVILDLPVHYESANFCIYEVSK